VKRELCISAAWLLLAFYFAAAATKLGLGAGGRPGPGFFPFGSACLIGIIALFRLLNAHRTKPSAILVTSANEWRKIACVIFGMLVFGLLLESLGFALCTFLLMAFYLAIVAAQNWRVSLGFAFAVAILSHLFFDTLLHAQLPRGILGAFL
jgi:putative tricarboxylic transport membrane protein